MATDAGNGSYTNGAPYLIVEKESIGDRSVGVHYLLPSGERRRVIVDYSIAEDDMLHAVGMALNGWDGVPIGSGR